MQRRTRRLSALLLALSLTTLGAGPAPIQQEEPAPQVFDGDRSLASTVGTAMRLVEVHRRSVGVPGMQVAVRRAGELVFSAGFGYADLERRLRVGRETRFRIGSTSKAFTGTLVALLADRGAIDLDAPIREAVPAFPDKGVPITARQLLGHTAGIRHYRRLPDDARRTDTFATMTAALEVFAADPLESAPGERVHYSSFGYNLLGALVESATGEDFLTALREHLLDPAGLRHTGGAGLTPDLEATAYVGGSSSRETAAPEDFSFKWPSGGLASTAEDLSLFGAVVLGGDLLPPATVEAVFTSLRTADGRETGYGYGWGLYTDPAGRRVASHGGNMDSARAHLLLYPDLELVVAVLANTGQAVYFNEGEAMEVGDLFARAFEEGSGDPAPPGQEWLGTWWLRAESPFGPGEVRAEIELIPPVRAQAGEVRISLQGRERAFPIALVEELDGVLRVVTAGGSHMEYLLEHDGDSLRGSLRPVWVAPPPGMLQGTPPEIVAEMAERQQPRRILEGGRRSGEPARPDNRSSNGVE